MLGTDGTNVEIWDLTNGSITAIDDGGAELGWPLQGFADLNGDGHKDVLYTASRTACNMAPGPTATSISLDQLSLTGRRST